MDRENPFAGGELWPKVQKAIASWLQGEVEQTRTHLQSAVACLQAAREALYPVAIHVVDICLLDDLSSEKPLPAAIAKGIPVNVAASGKVLEALGREHPERLAILRHEVREGRGEFCAGPYCEREDALLPAESQLWNLYKGWNIARNLLDADVRVFACKNSDVYPSLPRLLAGTGLHRVLLLHLDESFLSPYQNAVVTWPTSDGQRIEAFTRVPYRADSPQTYFHLAHYLYRTIFQDFTATVALLHRGAPASIWYEDWLELSRFAPVLGQWTTLSQYFDAIPEGGRIAEPSVGELPTDLLSNRTVHRFAHHARLRRRLDAIGTLAALHRSLAGKNDSLRLEARLTSLEDRIETGPEEPAEELTALQEEACSALAERLLVRAVRNEPGYLVLNPCSFTRRVAIEADGVKGPLPITGSLKACQIVGNSACLVVEVPALGFAWIPCTPSQRVDSPTSRIKMADERHVRNEFFEAEIDLATGGLRGLWDHRTRVNRLGQQLVYNPGSTMRAEKIAVTSAGPALGEIVSEGIILDETQPAQEQVLATFRQRFRAWLGRPVLEMRIEIQPRFLPSGYPWHAYFGSRFAWRDERALLLSGQNGIGQIADHQRLISPDFLEWRVGRQNVVLFPGGLPFHQRHGSRMLDVILIPQGEAAHTFDLALGLDREYPMQTALGMITPAPMIAVSKGPPHVGESGWLFHLDAPNLLLTSFRPAEDGAAITARFLECALHGGQTELHCVRNPIRAARIDACGKILKELSIHDDAVRFEASAGEMMQMRIEFGA